MEITLSQKNLLPQNSVIREIRDYEGRLNGYKVMKHNGDPKGIIEIAKIISALLCANPDFSNIQSRTIVTDENGIPKWSVSPNCKHLAEIGTEDFKYILGISISKFK